MRITLLGYMGAGKSSMSKKLALQLGLDYYDLDVELEKDLKRTITETIFDKGALFFRQKEKEKLDELLLKDNFVLSSGGGTPCYYDNIDHINQQSLSVYLRYSATILYGRLENHQDERPLIGHLKRAKLKEYIVKHLFERSKFYEKAIFSIACDGKTEKEILEEITELINK